MNKLKISLKDLRSAAGQRLQVPFSTSIEGQSLIGPAHGDIFLVANSSSVRLTGSIQATAKLLCHRCLNPFLQFLQLNLDEEFVYEDYLNIKTSRGKERELQKEDFFETVPYDGTIDISDFVYQAIVLATPNYCTCGPDCAGPPIYNETNRDNFPKSGICGTEMTSSMDPRWHNLKTIFSNDTESKKVSDNSSP